MKTASRSAKSKGIIARAEAREAQRGAATARIVVMTITLFIIGAAWLAMVTTVPELVRAQGELVPAGHYRQIQAAEQGIVRQVLIEEGETVTAGQVLTVLSSVELDRQQAELDRERSAAETRMANLRRIIDSAQDGAGFDGADAGVDMAYATAQLALFSARQEVHLALRDHLENTVETLRNARDLTLRRIDERHERVARAEQLFADNLSTRRDLDTLRDSLDQLQANLIEIDIRLSQAAKDLAGASTPLQQNLIALLEKTHDEMFELDERMQELALEATSLAKRRQALEIRSPETGVIHAIAFPNAGEVIAAGTTLFELMPSESRLIAELKIDPVDIGHIGPGDAVALKFDTFDARRFGQVQGRVDSISPNSVTDDLSGESYFRASVLLEQGVIGSGAWQRPLQAGLGTTAEIVADERSVMAYLMKPIARSFGNAFGER